MVGAAVGDLPCFKDLIAVLIECLLIISLGYLSGRFKLISTQAKDLNSYLTTFALPMIIFLNIAQMEFQTINLSFLICMLTAKLLVFILVTILTLTISYPRNFGYAGALSILATQSNDFALGYPLIKSLYGETKPEMLSYLSLMAPIQLLILNPLGIAMLEYNKSQKSKSNKRPQQQLDHQQDNTKPLCCHLSTTTPTPSPSPSPNNTNQHNSIRSTTQTSQVMGQQQSKHQLRLRKHLLSQGSHAGHLDDTHRLPGNGNVIMDAWQQSPVMGVSSADDQINSTTRLDSNDRNLNQTQIRGFKHRNIKALSLIMPTPNSNIGGSEDSIHSLSDFEGKFVDYGLAQQTRAKYNLDCQLERSAIEQQQSFVNQQQQQHHPPTTELNVDLPSLNCSRSTQQQQQQQQQQQGSTVNLAFLKALATNPLIIASVVALLVNLIHGPELPKFVTRVSNTIAASFAAPALFVVGLSMYGKFELFKRNPSDLLLSSVLVLTKVLILPNLMRTLALLILPKYTPAEELSYLIDFSFLYGLLPTAPTACIIANQYGVLSNVVSISMLLSTFISTPLMISSAFIISPATVIKVKVIENILSQTMQISSVVTLTLALLTLYAFWKSKKDRNYTNFLNIAEVARGSINKIRAKPTHVFLVLLAVSQIMIGLGGLIWYFVDTSKLDPVLNVIDPLHHSLAAFEENITKTPFDNNITLLVEPPETVTMPPVPSTQEPLAPPAADPLPGLESISGLDSVPSMDPPIHLPPTIMPTESLPEPTALQEHIDPLMIPRHIDLGLRALSMAQHVFSSYGLMMARFVVLCLLLTIGAMKLKGEVIGKRVADVMLKAYFLLAATLLIWLVFDSDQSTKHLPVEASLPAHTSSLWVRFMYDIMILGLSIPLFALIIRSYNVDKIVNLEQQRDKLLNAADNEVGRSFMKRRFLTSSASLSSDTSSALTSNTNLESSSNVSQTCVQAASVSQDQNNNLPNHNSLNDSMSIVLETGHFEVGSKIKRSSSPNEVAAVNISHSNTNSQSLLADDPRIVIGNSTENDQNRQYELDDPTNHNNYPHTSPTMSRNDLTLSEFNKYSLLIVFILINSTHNLTSIAQKLLFNEPFGTFRQVEVTNAALEFGQGLLTFLIYGMKGFST